MDWGMKGSSSDHPSNMEHIKFFKSTIIDNNHSAKTKKENYPPRRNEEKGTRTDQRNYQHERNQSTQIRQFFSQVQKSFLWILFFLF
jgi:hypothetical protein